MGPGWRRLWPEPIKQLLHAHRAHLSPDPEGGAGALEIPGAVRGETHEQCGGTGAQTGGDPPQTELWRPIPKGCALPMSSPFRYTNPQAAGPGRDGVHIATQRDGNLRRSTQPILWQTIHLNRSWSGKETAVLR
jgi:hypothetical protein